MVAHVSIASTKGDGNRTPTKAVCAPKVLGRPAFRFGEVGFFILFNITS